MVKFSDVRRWAESPIGKSIFFLLAASFFIGFGVISFQGKSGFVEGAVVAKVENEPITNRDVALVHQRLYESYKEQLGDQLNDDLLKQLNLRFQALSMLINRAVILNEAERIGLLVGPDELRDHIVGIEA